MYPNTQRASRFRPRTAEQNRHLQRRSHGRLRRSNRPGHHQLTIHDLRSWRKRARQTSARARPDPAARRLGGTQPGRDLGAQQRGAADGDECGGPGAVGLRRAGCHESARNRSRVEPQDRPPLLQRHRVAGHPNRPYRQRVGPGRPRRCHPHQGRSAACNVLLAGKVQWILENVDGVRVPMPSAATPCSATPTVGCCGI